MILYIKIYLKEGISLGSKFSQPKDGQLFTEKNMKLVENVAKECKNMSIEYGNFFTNMENAIKKVGKQLEKYTLTCNRGRWDLAVLNEKSMSVNKKNYIQGVKASVEYLNSYTFNIDDFDLLNKCKSHFQNSAGKDYVDLYNLPETKGSLNSSFRNLLKIIDPQCLNSYNISLSIKKSRLIKLFFPNQKTGWKKFTSNSNMSNIVNDIANSDLFKPKNSPLKYKKSRQNASLISPKMINAFSQSQSPNALQRLLDDYNSSYSSLKVSASQVDSKNKAICGKKDKVKKGIQDILNSLHIDEQALANENVNPESRTIKEMKEELTQRREGVNKATDMLDKVDESNSVINNIKTMGKEITKIIKGNKETNIICSPKEIQRKGEVLLNEIKKAENYLMQAILAQDNESLDKNLNDADKIINKFDNKYKAFNAMRSCSEDSPEDFEKIIKESTNYADKIFEESGLKESNDEIEGTIKTIESQKDINNIIARVKKMAATNYKQDSSQYIAFCLNTFYNISEKLIPILENLDKNLDSVAKSVDVFISTTDKISNSDQKSAAANIGEKTDKTLSMMGVIGCFTGVALSLACPIAAGVIASIALGATLYNVIKIWVPGASIANIGNKNTTA